VTGGPFDNPLILYSEHKRVLGDAIKRGDDKGRELARTAFWQGVSMSAIPAVIACLMAAVSGFLYGLSFVP
jgi:hypothetical protein